MNRLKSLTLGMLTAITLASPALGTTIPSVASGEAADREAALTSALRHAVEQVVGMSVETSTYVSNLKSIQDKVYTGATGYIESYDVVDEQHTGAGFRITVSARISKEKLSSAVAPILGTGTFEIDGNALVANLKIDGSNQKTMEKALKSMLDELPITGLSITYDLPVARTLASDPDWATVTV